MSKDRLTTDAEFRQFAGAFLKAASTGVDHLEVERKELSREEARALAPEERAELRVERDGDGERFYRVSIQAVHQHTTCKETPLALSEESGGTQRLLDLIPALCQVESGQAVYCIDEIDRSLHSMLVYKFLEYFLRSGSQTARQIIGTTHESHLLDLDLLRGDEVWFANKDRWGTTRLYPLTDCDVRKDFQMEKGYLEGRFGAVPFLGEMDHLAGIRDFRARYLIGT